MIKSDLVEKEIQTDKDEIFYYISENESSKPMVVFLHGLAANHTQCLEIIRVIEKAGFNCLVPDLRGHGKSDKSKIQKNYKFSVFTEDLRLILAKENIENITLIGYSFGGAIALDFSSRYPNRVKNLVLISTNYVSHFQYPGLGFLLPAINVLMSSFAFLLLWQKRKEYYYYRHDEALTYFRSVWLGYLTMPASINVWMLRNVILANFSKVISNIKAETLIIQAKHDPFITEAEVRDMKKMIPNCEVVKAVHESHFFATEAQVETANIILTFLEKNQ